MRVLGFDRLNLKQVEINEINQYARLMEITHLLPVVRLNSLEDEQEHLVDHVHDLVVVVLESHLEIETGELGQVPVGVGVLSPKHGADLVHSLHIGGDSHLFGQLRRLRQERRAAEVVDLEHGRTGLSGNRLESRRLDLGETMGIEEGSEKVGGAGASTENRVGDWGAEVDDVICKVCCLPDARVADIGPSEFSEVASSILDLERKQRRGGGDRGYIGKWFE